MKISSWRVNTELQHHVEVPPAFSAGNRWRYAEIFGTELVGSGCRGKGEIGSQNIVSMFFVSAKKTILDQQKGPVAKTRGRSFPGPFFIIRIPRPPIDPHCPNPLHFRL